MQASNPMMHVRRSCGRTASAPKGVKPSHLITYRRLHHPSVCMYVCLYIHTPPQGPPFQCCSTDEHTGPIPHPSAWCWHVHVHHGAGGPAPMSQKVGGCGWHWSRWSNPMMHVPILCGRMASAPKEGKLSHLIT
jgi:hypothetical protein